MPLSQVAAMRSTLRASLDTYTGYTMIRNVLVLDNNVLLLVFDTHVLVNITDTILENNSGFPKQTGAQKLNDLSLQPIILP